MVPMDVGQHDDVDVVSGIELPEPQGVRCVGMVDGRLPIGDVSLHCLWIGFDVPGDAEVEDDGDSILAGRRGRRVADEE